ncbi:MAG: glycoside hydrolase family 32 protein [Ginsengibacter sp.]
MQKLSCFVILLFLFSCNNSHQSAATRFNYSDQYRPQIHFSPRQHWMNDPNGMVYYHGTYHLFYQYYPDSTVWGPMHWGHATSRDLVRWNEQPVALYPDSLGYIFSGSAVVDENNTSGFGKNGIPPLVAIFTHHDPKGEKAGTSTFQNQSLAYSLDEGKKWIKYEGNPVLRNPGIRDFRDPKVCWYEPGKKWIMTLATLDRITFYSSPNLKDWKRESEFGKEIGAHGGVWECPDLFTLDYQGLKIWVLLINLNPGGPNGGSATQYFTGQFDGNKFIPFQTDTRWLDYGPDEYAGITWSNTGERKIFLGWMSNWQYAGTVPTKAWRSAMTIPRDLAIGKTGDKFLVVSHPVKELNSLVGKTVELTNIVATNYDLSTKIKSNGPARLSISSDLLTSFTITLSNRNGEELQIGYDDVSKNYFIDRTHSGNVSFEKGFGKKQFAPRVFSGPGFEMTLIIDNSSVELFADNGLSVMTAIYFPFISFSNISIRSEKNFKINTLKYTSLKSIWK